jgi:hypothetical protein
MTFYRLLVSSSIILCAVVHCGFHGAVVYASEIGFNEHDDTKPMFALRYRRRRVVQVDDSALFHVDTKQRQTSLSYGDIEIDDNNLWTRLLQSDVSLSTPITVPSQAPITDGKPTAVPIVPTTPSIPTPTTSQTTSPVIDCKSVTRMEAIVSLLDEITPDLGNVLPSSPQGMALDWIFNVDTTDPCLDPQSIQRRYALATFYLSTDGTRWSNSTGWLSLESECTWYGVTCSDDGEVERFELGTF